MVDHAINVPLLLVGVLHVGAVMAGTDYADKVRSASLDLLRAIGEKNEKTILSYVPDDGLISGDTRLTRNELAAALNRSGSYVRKALFSEPTKQEIDACNSGDISSLYVSPHFFYINNKDSLSIEITHEDGGYYQVAFDGDARRYGCELHLPPTVFEASKHSDAVYLETFFFE